MGSKPFLSDSDFIREFETLGCTGIAKKFSCDERAVWARRSRLEQKIGRQLTSPHRTDLATRHSIAHPHRKTLELENGLILVGSDAHYWPGDASVAHRGFVRFCRDLRPSVVVLNGDVIDAASISRYPGNWEHQPTVQEEIEIAQDRLQEIVDAATGRATRIWTLGNHDGRFETRLATVAPEFAKVAGLHLKDHFPLWQPCWSVFVNGDVVIKHRFKGGIHATHNSAMWAGRSIITGHLHSAKVTPLTDYNGTRYGVDTGCLADPDHAAFVNYTEDNPKNWRSAFCVLTFHKGRLMQPELALVWDDKTIEFRGQLITV